MEVFENQVDDSRERRMDAANSRTDADENRMDAANSRTDAAANVTYNVAYINVQNITIPNEVAGHKGYSNGHFLPVFQDAFCAIACNTQIKAGTIRILMYLLSIVDENNRIMGSTKTIAKHLGLSGDTVRRAISQLVSMQIICRISDTFHQNIYELTDKIINPRLAYKGNTRKLNKKSLPLLLSPEYVGKYQPPLLLEDTILSSDEF